MGNGTKMVSHSTPHSSVQGCLKVSHCCNPSGHGKRGKGGANKIKKYSMVAADEFSAYPGSVIYVKFSVLARVKSYLRDRGEKRATMCGCPMLQT